MCVRCVCVRARYEMSPMSDFSLPGAEQFVHQVLHLKTYPGPFYFLTGAQRWGHDKLQTNFQDFLQKKLSNKKRTFHAVKISVLLHEKMPKDTLC